MNTDFRSDCGRVAVFGEVHPEGCSKRQPHMWCHGDRVCERGKARLYPAALSKLEFLAWCPNYLSDIHTVQQGRGGTGCRRLQQAS